MKKASEIVKDLEEQILGIQTDRTLQSNQIDLLRTSSQELEEKLDEYKSMFYLAKDHLKKIARTLDRLNASKASPEELRGKIKTIRILLDQYNQKVIKKEYEAQPE